MTEKKERAKRWGARKAEREGERGRAGEICERKRGGKEREKVGEREKGKDRYRKGKESDGNIERGKVGKIDRDRGRVGEPRGNWGIRVWK